MRSRSVDMATIKKIYWHLIFVCFFVIHGVFVPSVLAKTPQICNSQKDLKQVKLPVKNYNSILEKPILNVMNELNELPIRFPNAISLASGRPSDKFCQPESSISAINTFINYTKKNSSIPVNRLLGQYGKTSGIINEIIAKHLLIDENIKVKPENIILTVGFQEAAALCAMTLFNKNDVLLVPDPIFIGIAGIATLYGIHIESIPYEDSLNINDIQGVIEKVRKAGKTVKAMYVISDFSNPQGSSLSLQDRKTLLAIAKKNSFLILEDNAYSMFRYEGEKIPSIKSLDDSGIVIYLGTFAKTLYPALRVGYIIVDQDIINQNGVLVPLIDEMKKVKSFLTVNTPALDQAIVAGILLNNEYSLIQFNEEKRKYYVYNRDVMVQSLSEEFAGYKNITWNIPHGGFFLIVNLPFNFTQEMLEECASSYNVIVFPESLLSLYQNTNNRIRLAFTNVPADEIKIAITRFANFVKNKMQANNIDKQL